MFIILFISMKTVFFIVRVSLLRVRTVLLTVRGVLLTVRVSLLTVCTALITVRIVLLSVRVSLLTVRTSLMIVRNFLLTVRACFIKQKNPLLKNGFLFVFINEKFYYSVVSSSVKSILITVSRLPSVSIFSSTAPNMLSTLRLSSSI